MAASLVAVNTALSDLGVWLTLGGILVVIVPWFSHWITRIVIPMSRRRRAWDMIDRLGKFEPHTHARSGPLFTGVQRLVIREEALAALQRRNRAFIVFFWFVYPLAGLVLLAAASAPEMRSGAVTLILVGTLCVAALPFSIASVIIDYHWNGRLRGAIDEILNQGEESARELLTNPRETVSEHCRNTGQKELFIDRFWDYLQRKSRNGRSQFRRVWAKPVRHRRAARHLRIVVKDNLRLRAIRPRR